MCINATAECDCGFIGADPDTVIPNWRIVLRSDNGSIISNNTINGADIVNGHINDLQWEPDNTSGVNNASNSKLLVGPVNITHNQSSYQCIFGSLRCDNVSRVVTVISSVGTITVVGKTNYIVQ